MSGPEVIAALRRGTNQLGSRIDVGPPLRPDEIEQLEARIGGPVDVDARQILAFASGITTPSFGRVDFGGRFPWEAGEIAPAGFPLALDRSGNAWVQDVDPETRAWGVVLYVSHDPPVLLVQAASLAMFVEAVIDLESGRPSPLLQTQDMAAGIWREDRWVVAVDSLRRSTDPALASFASGLPDGSVVADLRSAEVGSGMAWGKGGADANVVRSGLVFGASRRRKRRWW